MTDIIQHFPCFALKCTLQFEIKDIIGDRDTSVLPVNSIFYILHVVH